MLHGIDLRMLILLLLFCSVNITHCCTPSLSGASSIRTNIAHRQPPSASGHDDDELASTIHALCTGLNLDYVDPSLVISGVRKGQNEGISSTDLFNLASETAAYMSTDHPDYAKLASRIAVKSLHESTPAKFSEAIELLYRYVDPKSELKAGCISDRVYDIVRQNAQLIDSYIDSKRDFDFDYFGFKTLERLVFCHAQLH